MVVRRSPRLSLPSFPHGAVKVPGILPSSSARFLVSAFSPFGFASEICGEMAVHAALLRTREVSFHGRWIWQRRWEEAVDPVDTCVYHMHRCASAMGLARGFLRHPGATRLAPRLFGNSNLDNMGYDKAHCAHL